MCELYFHIFFNIIFRTGYKNDIYIIVVDSTGTETISEHDFRGQLCERKFYFCPNCPGIVFMCLLEHEDHVNNCLSRDNKVHNKVRYYYNSF